MKLKTINSLKRTINLQFAEQIILALLHPDGFPMVDWLEDEFSRYPTYTQDPFDWLSRFIQDATSGHAEVTYDPDRKQAQIRVGAGDDDEPSVAYLDVLGPVGALIKLDDRNPGRINATRMMALIQNQVEAELRQSHFLQ
jgi:hypothetical protein